MNTEQNVNEPLPASDLFAPAIMGRLLVEAQLQNMPWLNDVARLIGDMSVALIALTPHHSGLCCRQREDGAFVVTTDKCCCRPMEKLSRQITGHDAPVDWANK